MSSKDGQNKKPAYRATRRDIAVKTYTLNQESRHLRVENVNIKAEPEELVRQFALYGEVSHWNRLEDATPDSYTDSYMISFKNINEARFARRKLHKTSFVGLDLSVTYACELETIDDVRQKLQERRDVVGRKVAFYAALDSVPKDQRVKPKPTSHVWDEKTVTAEQWIEAGGNPLMIPHVAPSPSNGVVQPNASNIKSTTIQQEPHHPYYSAFQSKLPLPDSHAYSEVDYQQYYQQYYAQYYNYYGGHYPYGAPQQVPETVQLPHGGKKRPADPEPLPDGSSRAKIQKTE